MEILYIIIFFILGIILGSFYNVVGYRLPKNESIIKPKYSYCPSCKKRLTNRELIPVISYFVQKGKCRGCGEKIGFFYPMIELLTGLLFAVCYYSFGFTYELIIALTLVSMLTIIIVSDTKYLIIPDEVTITGIIVIVITKLFKSGIKTMFLSIGNGLIMFIAMYLIMLLGNYIFKKESLGGADVKLMFVVGLVVSPLVGFFVIFVASLTALPISLFLGQINNEKVIPFGPFIMLSVILFYFLKIDVNILLEYFRFI